MSFVRTVAERALRDRSWRRHLPRAFNSIPIVVSPDAALRWVVPGKRGFDPALLRIVAERVRSGMNVWDIGANVGVFTFAAAARSRTGNVVAVEPDPFLTNLLLKSAYLSKNRDFDVAVVSAAVSDVQGVSELHVARRGRSSNALARAGGRSQMGGSRFSVYVPTVTLDGMLESFPAPELVKIDVEGAEDRVLSGARHLLEVVRPDLIVEVGAEKSGEVYRSLHEADYVILDADASRSSREPLRSPAWQSLCVPAEHYPST